MHSFYFSYKIFVNPTNISPINLMNYLESVTGSVIQATGTVEFEVGLRTGVLQEDCWCPYSGHITLESDMARPLRPVLTQL